MYYLKTHKHVKIKGQITTFIETSSYEKLEDIIYKTKNTKNWLVSKDKTSWTNYIPKEWEESKNVA